MLDETGFYRPTYDELLNAQIDRAKQLFGDDIDTDEKTPLGKFIRITVYDLAKAWETLELTYYARFPNTASGVSLDRLCVFAGINRNTAIAATHQIEVTGTVGYTIYAGFLVSTDDNITFYSANDYVIDETGKVNIEVDCTQAGLIGNVAVGSITTIVNPDANIISIDHKKIISYGEDEETDTALRQRFSFAIAGAGSCNTDSIRAAILRVPTVLSVSIIENTNDTTDSQGRPPHSFQTYVYGGEDYHNQIAQAIFSKAPIGIKSYGDISVNLLDHGGFSHTIKFSHTTNINLKLRVSIKITNVFADDGKSKIANNLSSYVNNLGVGQEVIISSLYGYIHAVNGVEEVTSITISKDGGTTYTNNNVDISINEVAHLSVNDISITEVSE